MSSKVNGVRVYNPPRGCTCPPQTIPSSGFGAEPRVRRVHFTGNTECALIGARVMSEREFLVERSRQFGAEYVRLHIHFSGVPDTVEKQRQMFRALLCEIPDELDFVTVVNSAARALGKVNVT